MTNHPTELIFKKSRKHFGIRFHCIQTNEYIARKYISFAIVESNNISIIIVFQILTIYSKYIIIVTKNKIDSTYRFIIMSGNHLDPFTYQLIRKKRRIVCFSASRLRRMASSSARLISRGLPAASSARISTICTLGSGLPP